MHYNFSELIIKVEWIWKQGRCGHIPVVPCLQDWMVVERAGGPTHEKNKWVYPVVVRAHGWGRADAHRNRVVYIYALLVFEKLIIKDGWIRNQVRCGHIRVDPCLQDWGFVERVSWPTRGKNKWFCPVAVRAHGWGWAYAHQKRVVYIYALLV